ncbi:hypothetical protein pb186bvf_020675 [Paramecium bursaria]
MKRILQKSNNKKNYQITQQIQTILILFDASQSITKNNGDNQHSVCSHKFQSKNYRVREQKLQNLAISSIDEIKQVIAHRNKEKSYFEEQYLSKTLYLFLKVTAIANHSKIIQDVSRKIALIILQPISDSIGWDILFEDRINYQVIFLYHYYSRVLYITFYSGVVGNNLKYRKIIRFMHNLKNERIPFKRYTYKLLTIQWNQSGSICELQIYGKQGISNDIKQHYNDSQSRIRKQYHDSQPILVKSHILIHFMFAVFLIQQGIEITYYNEWAEFQFEK